MREVLLVSSELDTITTLLRPFEKLRDLGGNGGLKEFVFDVIRLSQQFERYDGRVNAYFRYTHH